jgi:hypothetical protein
MARILRALSNPDSRLKIQTASTTITTSTGLSDTGIPVFTAWSAP